MSAQQINALLAAYCQTIRAGRRANPAISEPALAPAFQTLVTGLLALPGGVANITVVPEHNNPGVGRPDIALIRAGEPARAFIELKAPAKSANPESWRDGHDKRQYERLKELPAWATANFTEFRLFQRDAQQGTAVIVPAKALDPTMSDAKATALLAAHDPSDFITLLGTLARTAAPAARDARQLAELLAHSARIVRSAVQERIAQLHDDANGAQHPLMLVRNTFREVLYAHPEAGGYSARDFDTLFSSAFAQTLAFGLLLVREATGEPTSHDSWRQMPDEHPLMRSALRVLSEEEVTREIGIGFGVMCDTVNSFAPEILAIQPDGRDPILYFYEDFLETFDPAAREKYGVYYTPIQVVRYMVGALDRALRDNLGTAGLVDPAVTILDPATGTGTFLLGVAERVRDSLIATEGGPAASMGLAQLASRMFGFELLVGPYAVAHYRLHHALRMRAADDLEDAPQPVDLPRLGIYLADTLSAPGAVTPIGHLGIQGIPISEERAAANRIKAEHPILAIIGNPPYKRLEEGENETLVGRWMDGIWDDLKRPVRDAGQGGQLNTFPEFSVAFWRWAIWKLFEADNAPQRGVIAFITNRKFLTGWPYAGLRKMMREKFDRIEVIDLRGDVRAGPRGDVATDQGVFNIMVGTAITIAIADGSKAEGALADVNYVDAWQQGLFTRQSKLDWLVDGAEAGWLPEAVAIDRQTLDDWRPEPFQNGEWLSVRQAFTFSLSGLQTKRDAFVYGINKNDLIDRITEFLDYDSTSVLGQQLARDTFHDSRDRKWLAEHSIPLDIDNVVEAAYRPLDFRYIYNHRAYGDFLRPALQSAWGAENAALYTMPFGVGAGPAVWLHSRLPDYHAFSGRGGYAFPLYDRREGPDASNINPILIAALSATYGADQPPEDIFDAILCLLSATSYTRRFAEDLEDVFPHIPFPADPAVFARAVAIGREIRALEAFQRPPAPEYRPLTFCRLTSQPADGTVIDDIGYTDGTLSLWKDAAGVAVPGFTGLPLSIWSFAVSGYRVLPRWIEGRKGLPVTLELMRELRDIAARIAELIHWFDAADLVLDAVLADTLTREELGFPDPDPDDEEEAIDDD